MLAADAAFRPEAEPVRGFPDGRRHALERLPLFAGLEEADALLLAVSGGPDSMALMRLAACWSRERTRPALHVATVDHGLRPAAAREAAFVGEVAATLGLAHVILVWSGPKPATRVQERARTARYGLLADHAAANGARHVLTAHHADDQAETVLMRLACGSGIGGLAGMRRSTKLAPEIDLVRPLLDLPKADLVAYCSDVGQNFVDDPSNTDRAFARARLRRAAPALASVGLDRTTVLRLSRRMARADEALEAAVGRLEHALAPERTDGAYRVSLATARETEPELLLRLLRRAVEHAGGRAPPRLERLEALTETVGLALRAGDTTRSTLGGTRVVLTRDTTLCVSAEPSRRRGRTSNKHEG